MENKFAHKREHQRGPFRSVINYGENFTNPTSHFHIQHRMIIIIIIQSSIECINIFFEEQFVVNKHMKFYFWYK